MAYTRKYEDQLVLIVNHLSRYAEPATLDLSGFEGLTPVEMLGEQEFPAVGSTPYFLTLSPYGYLWFRLERR